MPMGIISKTDYIPIAKKMNEGDIIVQVSDGVIPESEDLIDNYITDALKNEINSLDGAKRISNALKEKIMLKYNNEPNDDVTIIVTKINKNT